MLIGIVVNKRDIYEAARLMVGLHGDDAEAECERMAGMMGERGDREEARLWQRIRRAIEFLRTETSGTKRCGF